MKISMECRVINAVACLALFLPHYFQASCIRYQKPQPLKICVITLTNLEKDTENLKSALETLLNLSEIAGVLFIISSGGGAVSDAMTISNTIKKVRMHKPVVSVVIDICASGAYLIAAATDYIIANPLSIVGSIGVLMHKKTITNEVYMLNETTISIKSQILYKNMYHKDDLPPEIMDTVYEEFKKEVENRRHITGMTSDSWANGKVFGGKKALALKLIDQLGSISDALDVLKRFIKETKGITAYTDLIELIQC